MRWTPGGRSRNLEDQRSSSGGGGGGGFRGGGGGARLGLGGIVVLVVLSVIFKRDLVSEFAGGGAATSVEGGRVDVRQDSLEENTVLFLSSVLDSAQVGWSRLIPNYPDAKLTLFRDAVRSACGAAGAETGPFYCPADRKVYLDLSFFEQLARQFGAPGDFAQAYVLAHEIGHHVQNVLGTERKLREAQQANPSLQNKLSVAMELQADCYAGVWAYSAARNKQLEPGDLEEGLTAASAVGDDRLQKQSSGRVNPESFTHGSSAERSRWFRRGFDTGDPNQCDTFASVR